MKPEDSIKKEAPTHTGEDVSKLHNKNNNSKQQKINLYISGITLEGFVISWVSQNISSDITTLDLGYIGCSAFLIFLCLISMLEAKINIDIYRTSYYLKITGNSYYESCLQKYEDNLLISDEFNYEFRHLYFAIVGTIAAFWPFVMASIRFNEIVITRAAGFHVLVVIIASTFGFVIVPLATRKFRKKIKTNWDTVIRDLQKYSQL